MWLQGTTSPPPLSPICSACWTSHRGHSERWQPCLYSAQPLQCWAEWIPALRLSTTWESMWGGTCPWCSLLPGILPVKSAVLVPQKQPPNTANCWSLWQVTLTPNCLPPKLLLQSATDMEWISNREPILWELRGHFLVKGQLDVTSYSSSKEKTGRDGTSQQCNSAVGKGKSHFQMK